MSQEQPETVKGNELRLVMRRAGFRGRYARHGIQLGGYWATDFPSSMFQEINHRVGDSVPREDWDKDKRSWCALYREALEAAGYKVEGDTALTVSKP